MARSIFRVHGRVTLTSGEPAGGVFVAIVDADPDLDDLIALGVTSSDGSFRASFVAEAFNQEPGENEQWPDLYVVLSEARGASLEPILRKDFGKVVLDGDVDLGTIVIPPLSARLAVLGASDLRAAPGRGKVVKRLRLDDELARVSMREVAGVVESLTGWSGLSDGVNVVLVDDFLEVQRASAARVLGQSEFSEAQLTRISALARECDLSACAMWVGATSTMFLNRRLLEGQSLDFLKVTIGHELVHVGQSRAHPELDIEITGLQRDVWGGGPVDVAVRGARIAIMANVEGYAHYIETRYLRKVYTHATLLDHAARAADTRFVQMRAPKLTSAELAAKSVDELLLEASSTKSAQYAAGDSAYAERSTGETPALFDPTLKLEVQPDVDALIALFPAMTRAVVANAFLDRTPTTVGALGAMFNVELSSEHLAKCGDGELVLGPPLPSPLEKLVAKWAPGARVTSLEDLRGLSLASGWSVDLVEGGAALDAALRKRFGEPQTWWRRHEYTAADGSTFILSWLGPDDRCSLGHALHSAKAAGSAQGRWLSERLEEHRAANAAALAKAEAEALATGKETFDYAIVRRFTPHDEMEVRRYYYSHPELRTLEELERSLAEEAVWENS